MLHIKLKGMSTEHPEGKYAVITHTSDPRGGFKRSFFSSKSGHVAYQIKVEEV